VPVAGLGIRPHSNCSVAANSVIGGNSRLLTIACVFTVVGGYADTYSFLAHGHVFANAQTGNVVFFSVYASGGNWAQAVRHLPPIAAFALGVAVAKLVGVQLHKHSFHATLLCQALEFSTLTALSFVGYRLPDSYVVPMISFVAAIQSTSFSAVGPWSFNSAMTTGNLRDATSGLALWLVGRGTMEDRDEGVALSLICLFFLVGALCGGIYTRLDQEHALIPCAAVVAVGFLLTWRERSRGIPPIA
jgi:uncharacterized membrane protein YoaK (UPF0700 family)